MISHLCGVNIKNILICLFGFLTPLVLMSQGAYSDTLILDEMLNMVAEETVITATRADRSLSNVTVPTSIIKDKTIQNAGMVKLSDVLQEQSGIVVTASAGSSAIGGGVFGNGVQIQGMNPDYTLIMLDGEPITGRQGGVLDLTRFAVGNIQKVEIVKGPSSSLYGSEAMGGVINILTDQRRQNLTKLSLRYGSFQTWDFFGSINKELGRSSLYAFGHYNRSNGYDLTPETNIKTIDPHKDVAFQIKWTYRFSERTRLVWSNRFFNGIQTSLFSINNETLTINGNGATTDLNINPVVYHRWNDKINSTLRLYGSLYRYDQSLLQEDGGTYYADDFIHQYYRLEQQNDWEIKKNIQLVVGAGYNHQIVETNRYNKIQNQHISYAFSQAEIKVNKNLTVVPGLRYDVNSDYASRLSPKLSAQYKINQKSRINASYGGGFKAPDFRQLYLSYANPAAQGYRIFGANEFSVSAMEKELANGTISRILPEAYNITTLLPEISHGFNLGYHYQASAQVWTWEINLFYNDIQNLINYLPVAVQPNSTYVFSYKNTKRAFTSGIECNVSGLIGKKITWSAGYQFLFTGEQATVKALMEDKVFGRKSPTGSAEIMSLRDYTGLLGRSPHMANVKCEYTFPKQNFSINARAIYRGRWGVVDLDGNGFANMNEEFATGFVNMNLTAQKTIKKIYTVKLNALNVFNHKDEINTPNVAGTHFMATFICQFSNL
ncbi:MAG: TonB-dependent receptor [Saprospiraceae bacterium]|nr:TonB-dependent receptor [Saprospiraceae bacterium]